MANTWLGLGLGLGSGSGLESGLGLGLAFLRHVAPLGQQPLERDLLIRLRVSTLLRALQAPEDHPSNPNPNPNPNAGGPPLDLVRVRVRVRFRVSSP